MAIKTNKTALMERALLKLFSQRSDKAHKEYAESVKGTIYATQMVNYRNNLFNPLKLRPHEVTGVYEIDPTSEHGNKLDRLIRVLEDIQVTRGYLTYILNFVESDGEFNFIVFESGRVPTEREDEVNQFIQNETDKLKFIKRLRLLSEIV